MRSGTDVQWWSFTAAADGTYAITLSDLPNNYSLGATYPGGSFNTSSSGNGDRVRTVTLRSGDRVNIKVGVGSGGYSESSPYRISVGAAG